ncbi:MAG: hypothetical protein KGZ79_01860 [Dethiobacter sp.]|nr:hypothetical protein [Dethiobacter sp.]
MVRAPHCKNKSYNYLYITLILMLAVSLLLPHAAVAWRAGQAAVLRSHYAGFERVESDYFHIRINAADSELAPRLAQEADRVVGEVAKLLPHIHKTDKPWLIIAPDQKTLKAAFSWGEGTGALGVYMVDTLTILSPSAWDWVTKEKRLEVFLAEGPLAHEYTHYVLDLRTGGNYPYWFSEGLAQLVEYKLNGYEWVEQDSSLSDFYTLAELESDFTALDRQALAYRQALSKVSYLESLRGMEGLNDLLDDLGRGISFYQALSEIYGLDRGSFTEQWQSWFRQDQRWFLTASRK